MKASMTTMTVAGLMALAIGGFYIGHKKESSKSLFNDSDSLFKNAENIKASPPSSPTPMNQAKPAASSDSPVKYVANDSSISRRIAIAQARQGNYYESIVSEVEGFRSHLYNDNTGYAIGNGWNVSLQSAATNQRVTQGIGLSPEDSMALAALSGMQKPRALPGVAITPEQATKAAQLMRAQFEQPMRKLVPSFDHLKPNEQAALIYHTYKVGPSGIKKYTGMIEALKNYNSNASEANRMKVADSFTYTYRMNGKVFTDSRSKLYLAALFTSSEAYSYLLGTTQAPSNFNQVAKLASQKIDTSKPADGQIQDDFGKAKDELLKQGKVPDITQDFKQSSPVRQQTGYWF